ncbi:MAG TPA: PHB depolymerase family esterase [Candidatus Binataceae bacterium]|nr:PHB depolymerase family esterase [Candidatus Binataceae bacterium]
MKRGFARIRSHIERALMIGLIAATATLGCASRGADAGSCGPFGNPPAKIDSSPEPFCWSGNKLPSWKDSDGSARYACVYEPKSPAKDHKVPLLVFLHPSLLSADSVKMTNLLDFVDSGQLSDDPSQKGFIVLAPQGRKTSHFYPWPDDSGYGWDNWYRQFNFAGDVKIGDTVYRENVDAAAIDHFIAEEVATGKVDTRRIYVTGWSNGAAMAFIYGLNRPNIAAIAVYSAPDPFGALDDPCQQKPVATAPDGPSQIQISNPWLPAMHVYNSCDTAGICANAKRFTSQLQPLGVGLDNVIIDGFRNQVTACDDSCGTNLNGDASPVSNPMGASAGFFNHVRWPSYWTPAMLDFMRRHPLAAPGH